MSSVAEVRAELKRINKDVDKAKQNNENTRTMLAKDAARLQEALGESSQDIAQEVLNDLNKTIREFPRLDDELRAIQEKAEKAGAAM